MSFSTRTIQGAVGRLAVTTAGEGGLPVLFVHGNSGTRTQWAAQQAHLRQRSVSLDLRGMGESDPDPAGRHGYADCARDVGAVVDALGLERFVLVGHSFGCVVAAEYAAQHPERVVALGLGDPGPSMKHIPPRFMEPLRNGLKPENYEAFRLGWFDSMLKDARPATREAILGSLVATPREVVVGATESLYDCDVEALLERYPGPIFDIAAELTLAQCGPFALHLRVPRVQTKVLAGVSHWLMMDAPEAFNAALDGFLASVGAASRMGAPPGSEGSPMRKTLRKTLPLLLCLLSTGCVTHRATAFSVPKERATECVANCAELDMKLAAVVIISNSAGCVCEPREEQLKASLAGAAAAAGGQMIQEENAQRQRHQQQQQQSMHH